MAEPAMNPRVVVFVRLPDAANRTELDAYATAAGGRVVEAHWGPDGRLRGTAIVTDTHSHAAET